MAYVRNIGTSAAKVDAVFPLWGFGVALMRRGNETFRPSEARPAEPAQSGRERQGKCYVKLSSAGGSESVIVIPSRILAGALRAKVPLMGLQATVSSSHWVVLDCSSGHYRLYGDYGLGASEGALIAEGYAPYSPAWTSTRSLTRGCCGTRGQLTHRC
ncbi:MAG: hypothetical protein DRJ56_01390 [Thermoprotei archaeon]|nr:MAG: hypothetical protein DRJ56_01390 [Thermoprotei archaeon]